MEFLKLLQGKELEVLAHYVQEFNAKQTFITIKEELTKKLVFFQCLKL
jgi:hypothetical protein